MWRHSSSKSTDSHTVALPGDELGATTNIHAEHPTTRLRRLRLNRVNWESLGQLCGLSGHEASGLLCTMQSIAEDKIGYTIRLKCDGKCWKCCCPNGMGQKSSRWEGSGHGERKRHHAGIHLM
ncbi:unnamed protein product [Fusarium venenatum]|uniref:Uncharacterized protein n=1 Tax=Fusarium venenatum TaxID=56646 RepID=A0A2L2TJM0_9HYPO|nr:LOW QUALITY PROTEIN: uncharacterized protein FVRRES_10365 [Fusarium venenatum]CEI70288.1 unnamed protein product [Fusarium venenatum]